MKKKDYINIGICILLLIVTIVLFATDAFNLAIPFNVTLRIFSKNINIVSIAVLVFLLIIFASLATGIIISIKMKGEDSKLSKVLKSIFDYLSTFVIAIDIVYLVFVFIAFPVTTQQTSMTPNVKEGERLIINIGNKDLERGDIVVFKVESESFPLLDSHDGELWLKRVIGLPGEKISFIDGYLYVNGELVIEEYLMENGEFKRGSNYNCYLNLDRKNCKTLEDVLALSGLTGDTIPEGYYLLLGDNRENSMDSWTIGLVPQDLIVGEAKYKMINIFKYLKIE